jgi:hypothetical protein
VPDTEPAPVTGVRPAGRDPVEAASACAAPLTKGVVVVPTEPVVSVPPDAVVAPVGTEAPVPPAVVVVPVSAAALVPVEVVAVPVATAVVVAQRVLWGTVPDVPATP